MEKDNPFYTIGKIHGCIHSVHNKLINTDEAVKQIEEIISEYDIAKEESFQKCLDGCKCL